MVHSRASMLAILVILQLWLVHAQETEGKRRQATIGVARQADVTEQSNEAIDASGTYTDPRRHGALRDVKVDGSDIIITGTRNGKSWSATGTIDGSTVHIDLSAADESEDLDGTVYANGVIQWSDGSAWTKQQGKRAMTLIAGGRKSHAPKPLSDADDLAESGIQSTSTDLFEDGSDQSDANDNSTDNEVSDTMASHIPRIAFVAFLVVVLLVTSTDVVPVLLGRDVFEALKSKVLMTIGKAQGLAKAKGLNPSMLPPIVSEAASVMEFNSAPTRPEESSQKPQVSSMIDAAFDDVVHEEPRDMPVPIQADSPNADLL